MKLSRVGRHYWSIFSTWWKRISLLKKIILIVSFATILLVGIYAIIRLQNARADANTLSEESSSQTLPDKVVGGIGASAEEQKAAATGKRTGTTSASSSTGSSSSSGNGSSVTGGSGGSSSTGTNYIVALGDSLTNAAALQPDMPGDNKNYSFSTGTSISSLYLTLKNQGLVTNAANLAVSGATSASCLSGQVPSVSQYSPAYVSILIGGNDIIGLVAPGTFQTNLASIAAGVQASGRRVLIGNIPNYASMMQAPIPACQANPLSPEQLAFLSWGLGQYNSAVSAVASQYGFTLVDLYSTLGQSDISELDCIHVNISGQQKMASRFSSAL